MDNSTGNWSLVPNIPEEEITGTGADKDGTVIWEVDSKGHQVGPEYYSLGWTNRNAPEYRKSEASPQWIEEMIISTSRDGARAGVDSDNLLLNLPLKDINKNVASSSPFNRDVLVKLVDQSGKELTRFTVAFLTVVESKPSQDDPAENVATKILISNFNIFHKPAFTLGPDGKPVYSGPSDEDGCDPSGKPTN